jgi:hypothetical protein
MNQRKLIPVKIPGSLKLMLSSDTFIGYPTARLLVTGFPIEILHVVAISFLTVLSNLIIILLKQLLDMNL